jgi:sulfate permease, SulP family
MNDTNVETIPILINLSNEQFDKFLGICAKIELPDYTVLFKEGDPPNDMYVLTKGSLKVMLHGEDISRIVPISTVGEMGVFTGEPRAATIVSLEDCTLLRIMKMDLFGLFARDKDFHIKFQEGMLIDLAHKMRETNEVIAHLQARLRKSS